MLKKPTKPWKNLEDARIKVGYCFNKIKRENKNIFPCQICNGDGRIAEDITYDQTFYKKCINCNVTGIIPKKDFIKYYKLKNEQYKKELKEYEYKSKKLKEIISRLSKEDINILHEYFNN